jgi:hypothetical protein
MSDWQIKVPGHPKDRLNPSSIFELSNALEDPEEKAVTRDMLLNAYMGGLRSVGEVLGGLKSLNVDQRRWVLDRLRTKAGLPSTKVVEARREYKAANQAGAVRSSGYSAWQACPACGCVPVDENTGVLKPVSVKRWWCEAHRREAAPGDMEPFSSGIRLSDCGVPIPYDEGEQARAEAEAEVRRQKLEADMAIRKREAEDRRRYEQAIADDIRRHTPPGAFS